MITKYDEYIKIYKDYKKFEKNNKFVWSRYYLEDYQFNKRVNFVSTLIKENLKEEFVIEIQFWDKTNKIKKFFKQLNNSYSLIKDYNNGKKTWYFGY